LSSIGRKFVDGLKEAFHSFVVDDHLVIEEGEHVNFLEILPLHIEDYYDSDDRCHHPPTHRRDEY